jgi:type I restriction enzyme M protein
MSLGTTIKSIQDIMRKDVGVDGDAQRIGQLGWLLFLKVFDDRDQERELLDERYVSPIPERLRWRAWAADDEGLTGDALLEFVNGDLFPTLKKLEIVRRSGDASAVVRGVFEDAYNYMKSGTLLRQVINKVNEIDFNRSSDRHLFNDIYEQILRDLQSAGNAGEYYTPRAVTRFMTEMTAPRLGEKLLDPACGTGGFLVNAIEYVRDREVQTPEQETALQRSIHGVEKKPLPHLLATTNLLLHGLDVPTQVRRDNTLARPLRDRGTRDRVDVILTNPPFGGEEEEGVETNFPAQFQTRETADLFLVLIMHLLKDGGRAAVVLPDGVLFGEGIKTRIKEKLLAECDLHTIVRLPKGVFAPYTGINTNLLFFTKGRPTSEVWYYEHPYPPGRKSYSKTKPIRIEEFDTEKAWWTSRDESEHAWRVPVEEIRRRGYNLDVKNPNAADEDHRDPDELLAEYRQILAEVEETREALKAELAGALESVLVAEVRG